MHYSIAFVKWFSSNATQYEWKANRIVRKKINQNILQFNDVLENFSNKRPTRKKKYLSIKGDNKSSKILKLKIQTY